jgi:hypothetical protein
MSLPLPPLYILDLEDPVFQPSEELREWVFSTFINEGAALRNVDHEHLQQARIGFLYTNVPFVKRGKKILGTAGVALETGGDAWSKGKKEQQLREWFGPDIPDFVITLDAFFFANADDDASKLAVIEHELYHCAQRLNRHGSPMFDRKTGQPCWRTRPHDVEEFVGVVARYGAGASPTGVNELVEAAKMPPWVGRAEIAGVCGTCI